jgi:hypothetical protein
MGVHDEAGRSSGFGNEVLKGVGSDVNRSVADGAHEVTVGASHQVKDGSAAAQMGVLGETNGHQLIQDAIGR